MKHASCRFQTYQITHASRCLALSYIADTAVRNSNEPTRGALSAMRSSMREISLQLRKLSLQILSDCAGSVEPDLENANAHPPTTEPTHPSDLETNPYPPRPPWQDDSGAS